MPKTTPTLKVCPNTDIYPQGLAVLELLREFRDEQISCCCDSGWNCYRLSGDIQPAVWKPASHADSGSCLGTDDLGY